MTYINNEKTLMHGVVFDVVEQQLCNDELGNFMRQIVKLKNNAVAFAMLDTSTNRIFVNYEYRSGVGKIMQSIPAGKINEGEIPQEAMIREMREETGYTFSDIGDVTMKSLGGTNSSEGFTNEIIYTFLIMGDFSNVKQHEPLFDDDEFITGQWMSITDWMTYANNNIISAPARIATLALNMM